MLSVDGAPKTAKPPDLVYRDYQPGDERQIVSLMSPYWQHAVSCDGWIHEYLGSPDGPCVSRICEADGRIIGHDGLILMQMTVADKNILGGKVEGSAVDGEYRKTSPRLSNLPPKDRSIFVRLSREVWQEGIARDVGIMWGFPNTMALGGHLKAGFDSWVLHQRSYIRPVSIAGTARLLAGMAPRWSRALVARLAAVPLWLSSRRLRSLKQSNDTTVMPVQEFDERVDRFWDSLAKRRGIYSINRTCRHLNWRFAHEPYVRAILISDGQLVGYAIGLLEDKGGFRRLRIVDLVIEDNFFSSLGQLLGGLLDAAESKIDLVSITCYFRGCDYGERLNKEIGKYFIPASRLHSQAAIIKVSPTCGDVNSIKDPARWFLTDIFRELF